MTRTADIVVAGAGHNSLVTAAYLARAGYECAIVDARPVPGGGATTESMMGGLAVDTCSTGHTLIQVNPLIRDDELGLVHQYGLSYIDPDPVEVVAMPDGEAITMYLDRAATQHELARFSERDAETYGRLLDEWEEVKSLIGGARFRPVGYGPDPREALLSHPKGSIWLRRSMLSARDVILHEYEDEHVRAFMGWMASQTAVPIDGAGTGLLAIQIIGGRQLRSWSIPSGGSGKLIDALVAYLTDHGATIDCDTRVTELIIEDGRCVGLRTDTGGDYRARKAVVSTIHVKHLVDMAPEELWGDGFVYGVNTYHVGIPFFAAYYATAEPPVFTTHDGGRSSVSAGVTGWLDDLTESARKVADGKLVDEPAFLLAATPTIADPSRTPDGRHAVKIVTFNAYDPGGGPERWDEIKERHADRLLDHLRRFAPNLTDEIISDRIVKSPLDIERDNPHMVHGAPHGGDRGIAFTGSQRPVPGWAQHRMPIPGLYQTGGTTHPGGSITGAPGRNAAIVLLEDLGRDPGDFMRLS